MIGSGHRFGGTRKPCRRLIRSVAPLRAVQDAVFGIAGGAGDTMSLQMLVLIGSLAYFTSFLAVHLLPERAATLAAEGTPPAAGPERWLALPAGLRRATNWGALALGTALLAVLTLRLKFDPVASVLTTFLGVCLIRKSFLDARLRRRRATS